MTNRRLCDLFVCQNRCVCYRVDDDDADGNLLLEQPFILFTNTINKENEMSGEKFQINHIPTLGLPQ